MDSAPVPAGVTAVLTNGPAPRPGIAGTPDGDGATGADSAGSRRRPVVLVRVGDRWVPPAAMLLTGSPGREFAGAGPAGGRGSGTGRAIGANPGVTGPGSHPAVGPAARRPAAGVPLQHLAPVGGGSGRREPARAVTAGGDAMVALGRGTYASGRGRTPGPGRPGDAPRTPPAQYKAARGTAALGRAVAVLVDSAGPLARQARKRPVLTVGLVTVGVGAVAASAFGTAPAGPEFRPPPIAAVEAPAVDASATAAVPGLAPYERPTGGTGSGPVPGKRSPSSAVDRNGSPPRSTPAVPGADPAPPGVRNVPARRSSPGAAVPVPGSPAATRLADRTAAISFGQPRDGDLISAVTPVSGTAELPRNHRIWMLSRAGADGAYLVEGACRGGRNFTCGAVSLESGEVLRLTVIIVAPATARTLSAGEFREVLPAYRARSEITIRRAG